MCAQHHTSKTHAGSPQRKLSSRFFLCPEGFIGIGVPIGTDAFVRNFVAKTCRAIIDDVEKLDAIQDGVVHYQLVRFCQATRLQYTKSHILLVR